MNCVVQVFNKFVHSFVAVEFLTSSIIKNSIFIAQESSRYLGFILKKNVRKQDFCLFFCVYKNVSKKIFFCIYCKDDQDSALSSYYINMIGP